MILRIILISLLVASCTNPDSKLLERDMNKIKIIPSVSNEYIGFSNLYEMRKDENIMQLWVYEKYIIIQRIIDKHIAGFDVYIYTKNLRILITI